MEAAKPANADGVIAYLGLGSNMGDSLMHLENGLVAIGMLTGTRVLSRSQIYVTAAWGKTDQPDFLNMVAEISTELPPEALLDAGKKIEQQEGRTEGERWGPRQLDIDILLYGNERLNSSLLTVPHPRIWERAFVLRPLADLLPELRGPDGRPVSEWLQESEIASQGVRPYRVNS